MIIDTADLRVPLEGNRCIDLNFSGIYMEEAELNVFAPNACQGLTAELPVWFLSKKKIRT